MSDILICFVEDLCTCISKTHKALKAQQGVFGYWSLPCFVGGDAGFVIVAVILFWFFVVWGRKKYDLAMKQRCNVKYIAKVSKYQKRLVRAGSWSQGIWIGDLFIISLTFISSVKEMERILVATILYLKLGNFSIEWTMISKDS